MRLRVAAALAVTAVVASAWSSEGARIARSAPDRGLALRVEVGETVDVRKARLVALHVPDGTAASPFVPAGRVKATWTGYLNLDLRTRITFSARGRGRVKLTVKGKVLLEGEADDLATLKTKAARVRKGANPFTFEYVAPESGDATVRLMWQGRDFPLEPVQVKALTFDPKEVLGFEARRNARVTFAEHRCVKCHRPSRPLPPGSMPELDADAPSFQDIGSRLDPKWMAAWMLDPKAMRPQATMPKLFAHATIGDALKAKDTRAFDVAAYLASLGGDRKLAAPEPTPELAKKGGVVFAKLGCVGCHIVPGSNRADDKHDRIPLDRVDWKFRPGALAAFLKDPTTHYQWVRMPHFRLTDDEAHALAAYLRMSAPELPAIPPIDGDAERGKKLVVELGCTNCHEGAGEAARPAPTLEEIADAERAGKGCLSAERGDGVPDPQLDDAEREGVLGFLSSGNAPGALRRRSLTEFAERQVDQLRCTACHRLDDANDLWDLLGTETLALDPPRPPKEGEEKISQLRPSLTWTGEKFHTSFSSRFLAGELPAIRTWLDARMPGFPSRAELLALGLSESHGYAPSTPSPPKPDLALAKHGEQLLRRDGFGCTSCHGHLAQKPYATFEFAAPNFGTVYSRVREEHYTRWMWHPQRVDDIFRMPIYAYDDGTTVQDEILEGDAKEQFRAMWHYLMTLHGK